MKTKKKTPNVSIYDAGNRTIDRVTIVFNDTKRKTANGYMYDSIGSSWTGAGFFQHSDAMKVRCLGKKISFSDLSPELQSILKTYFDEYGGM